MAKRFCLFAALIFLAVLTASATDVDFRGYSMDTGYQYFTFGAYPQTVDGSPLPILWRVLQEEDGILYAISDVILDVGRIDGDQWNFKGWAQSELFARLNSDMLNAAFTAEERAALQEDPELGFFSLPSAEDIKNPAFGFGTAKSRQFVGTPYAAAQGLFHYSSRVYSPIWTRTQSTKPYAHRSTKVDGNSGFIGVEADDLGILPVVWVRLDRIAVQSGSGTREDPFVFVPAAP
jgi:hypothetical protein